MNGQPRDYHRLRKIVEICSHQQKLKANNRKYANGSDNKAATLSVHQLSRGRSPQAAKALAGEAKLRKAVRKSRVIVTLGLIRVTAIKLFTT